MRPGGVPRFVRQRLQRRGTEAGADVGRLLLLAAARHLQLDRHRLEHVVAGPAKDRVVAGERANAVGKRAGDRERIVAGQAIVDEARFDRRLIPDAAVGKVDAVDLAAGEIALDDDALGGVAGRVDSRIAAVGA